METKQEAQIRCNLNDPGPVALHATLLVLSISLIGGHFRKSLE